MNLIHPIFLAGGSGKRLWPISRESYPKQFHTIIGDNSLFQNTIKRLYEPDHLNLSAPTIMTNFEFRFIVKQQLKNIDVNSSNLILEPVVRNTGPSVLAAAIFLHKQNPNSICLVVPCDHNVPDANKFCKEIANGLEAVKKSKIVAFGVKPSHAETMYGYLKKGLKETENCFSVIKFIEKPSREIAEEIFKQGDYFWNSGVFLFNAKQMIDSFRRLFPSLVKQVEYLVDTMESDLGSKKLDMQGWQKCENISLDYAIMEKIDNLSTSIFSCKWNDLGNWDSIHSELKNDLNNNVAPINSTLLDCNDILLHSEDEGTHIAAIGLSDLIGVVTKDAVLLAKKSRSKEVGTMVEMLNSKGISQGSNAQKEHRPWGYFETLFLGPSFRVKKIIVYPKHAISLQRHKHRSEHWVIVGGVGKVTLENEIVHLKADQSIYIPLGAVHRLENEQGTLLQLIEVQTGNYLEEDDIERLEDNYSRAN
ncbi:MAG: mannose-1-phosphate guanylyltransferase/mannose-6-phosphate isomerase [Candidatus Endolissoclinum sp. TMED37]|nr:MAG: mannose-1-phosphate guanylyltransferase/mannose-6-phosphate isomerase [Candidatus Endolissoclinum sp. TMED37]|tara:strand:+ start:278 stop:1708 length:1431 start_codon:yes stop_codon:yes gene_type:complete